GRIPNQPEPRASNSGLHIPDPGKPPPSARERSNRNLLRGDGEMRAAKARKAPESTPDLTTPTGAKELLATIAADPKAHHPYRVAAASALLRAQQEDQETRERRRFASTIAWLDSLRDCGCSKDGPACQCETREADAPSLGDGEVLGRDSLAIKE